ncbi:MAG: cysteine synthase family protein [Acidobacteriota bacterium]
MSRRDDLFACIGGTPTFLLPKVSAAAGAQIFGKAEYLNPGGSIKDRIALAMVEAAERAGPLAPGTTLVEATAGNTGIGLAWIAAARGYRFVAVMNAADRGPKTQAMEAVGAECVLLDSHEPWDSEEGALGVARRIAESRGGLFLNQFENDANPVAHEHGTAPEIVADMEGDVDAVIVGIGTGGTVTGLARGFAKLLPNVRLIGVAAEGSYLGTELEGDRIAGITPDFPPRVFEQDLLHRLDTITGDAAAVAARRLAEIEGIPAGHSSGALLLAAEAEARRNPGSRILFTLCDSLRNYKPLW